MELVTSASNAIGILGGTFDPIHHGHLRLALEAYYQLQLQHVHLIPLYQPVHRHKPRANGDQRSDMIKLAIGHLPMLRLDRRELDRNEASYTIDTLQSLRAEFPQRSLCLLMGRDSFSTLDQWKKWEQLLDYAHIIIASRHLVASKPLKPLLQELLQDHGTQQLEDLHSCLAGHLFELTIPLLDISASEIRDHVHHARALNYLLPTSVIDYIQEQQLYV